MPLEQVLERYNKGPVPTLRKKAGQDMLSPAIQAKQNKAPLPDGADSGSDSKGSSNEGGSGDDCQVKLNFDKLINGHSDNENNENIEREIRVRQQQSATNENGTETQMDTSSTEPSTDPEAGGSSSSQGGASNSAGSSGSSAVRH